MKKIIAGIFLIIGLMNAFARDDLPLIEACTLNAAYSDGVEEGSKNLSPHEDYAVACDVSKDFHTQLNAAYNFGYKNGLAHIPVSKVFCLQNNSGASVCGYDCKKDRYGEVTCANFPTQKCLVDRFTKKVVCGYACLKSTNGTVYCGSNYDDNCIQDAYGQAKCGLNCRLSGGTIQCDQRILQTSSNENKHLILHY